MAGIGSKISDFEEVIRGGWNALTGQKEIKEVYGQEKDVRNAYSNLAKQQRQASKALSKWGAQEDDDVKSVLAKLEANTQAKAAREEEFTKAFNEYLDQLSLIQKEQKKMQNADKAWKTALKNEDKLRKQLKSAQKKLNSAKDKPKAEQDIARLESQLATAKAKSASTNEQRKAKLLAFKKLKNGALRNGLIKVNESYIEMLEALLPMYKESLELAKDLPTDMTDLPGEENLSGVIDSEDEGEK